MTELEPLPFLGDIMLISILRPLWQSERPAIRILEEFPDEHPMRRYMLEITELGRALVECRENWLSVNKEGDVDRNVGGVRIRSGRRNWYWSGDEGGPVLL